MEKFRELYIKVGAAYSKEFAEAINAALTAGWNREYDTEARAKQLDRNIGEILYYSCDRRESRSAALVAFRRRDAETFYVTNVVPREASELNHQQYNAVLQDFYDSVLTKLHARFPVTNMLDSNELRIEDLMSAEAFDCLRQFSSMANKSTGSAHPMDRERWYEFLVMLNRAPNKLDGHALGRWLIEVEEWPAKVAGDLESEFEFAMGLLKHCRRD